MKFIAIALALCVASCSISYVHRDVRGNEPIMRCSSDWLYPALDSGGFLLMSTITPLLFASDEPDGVVLGAAAMIMTTLSLATAIIGWAYYANCGSTSKLNPWRI